jgi:hypothetical protein
MGRSPSFASTPTDSGRPIQTRFRYDYFRPIRINLASEE